MLQAWLSFQADCWSSKSKWYNTADRISASGVILLGPVSSQPPPKPPCATNSSGLPLTHAFLPFKTFDHDGLVTTGSDHPLSHRRDHLQAPGPPPPGDQRHRAVVEQEVKVPEGVLCAAHVLAYHRVPFGLPLRGQDFVQQDLRPVLAVPEPVLEVRSMRREH